MPRPKKQPPTIPDYGTPAFDSLLDQFRQAKNTESASKAFINDHKDGLRDKILEAGIHEDSRFEIKSGQSSSYIDPQKLRLHLLENGVPLETINAAISSSQSSSTYYYVKLKKQPHHSSQGSNNDQNDDDED